MRAKPVLTEGLLQLAQLGKVLSHLHARLLRQTCCRHGRHAFVGVTLCPATCLPSKTSILLEGGEARMRAGEDMAPGVGVTEDRPAGSAGSCVPDVVRI